MPHSYPGGSPGKSLDLPKRQETIVLGCVRRGDSFPVCPQRAEHHLNEFQRRAQAVGISLGPRDGQETLMLLLQPPRILCRSTGHYPQCPASLCSLPLPGSSDPRRTSLGEHTVCLKLLQCHASLSRHRLAPHSNYNYRTPPSPWHE